MDERSQVLYFLQRLRDEAHRFAIGGHRKKRSKAIGVSPLDEIAGVGRSRKKALLSHFGSARAVAQASLADLTVGSGRKFRSRLQNLRILSSGVGSGRHGVPVHWYHVVSAQCADHRPYRGHSVVCRRFLRFGRRRAVARVWAVRAGRNYRCNRRHDRAPVAGGIARSAGCWTRLPIN